MFTHRYTTTAVAVMAYMAQKGLANYGNYQLTTADNVHILYHRDTAIIAVNTLDENGIPDVTVTVYTYMCGELSPEVTYKCARPNGCF